MRWKVVVLLALTGLAAAIPSAQEEDEGEVAKDEEYDEVEYDEELVAAFANYAPGLPEPSSEDLVGAQEFVSYFEVVGSSLGSSTPSSYSAVKEGTISPVKDQGYCGACAAFATTAVLETCNKRTTGSFGNYSEQQLLDCAYGYKEADACLGAQHYVYLEWAAQNKTQLANSKQMPYKGDDSPFDCPIPMPVDQKAAVASSLYYTYNGTEEQLKALVHENHAVLIGVWFTTESWEAFKGYKKGIFSCSKNGRNVGGHAMVAVGYGREKSKDYWLVKNSFGTTWGEKGYIKILRGQNSCSIGRTLAVVECTKPPQKKKPKKKKKKKLGLSDCGDDCAIEDALSGEEYDEEEEDDEEEK